MTNAEKGLLGEGLVVERLKKDGYEIIDKPENGCDIVASKNGEKVTIEVKTTSNLNGGIPDMHVTEFTEIDGKWYFVADYLHIVRLDENNVPVQIDILSKSEIDSFADSHKAVLRIRTTKLDRALYKMEVGSTTII